MPTELPNQTADPIRFDPSFEVVAHDEADTVAGIVDTMRSINAKTLADSGHANRSTGCEPGSKGRA